MTDETDRTDTSQEMVDVEMTGDHIRIVIQRTDEMLTQDFNGSDLIDAINAKFSLDQGGTNAENHKTARRKNILTRRPSDDERKDSVLPEL